MFAGWYGGGCYPNIVPDPNIKDRVYLLSDVVGVWRSDNRGEKWYFINKGVENLTTAVLAIAPSNSDVMYLGTKAGVMRSDNAGKTWRYLTSTRNKVVFERPKNYRCIAVDPFDHDILYAGTKFGTMLFSKDGGRKWRYLGGKNRFLPWSKYPFRKKTPITAVCLTDNGKRLFAASESGLRYYDFQRKKWLEIKTPYRKVWDMVCLGQDEGMYITSGRRISFSADYGKTWQHTRTVPYGEIIRIGVRKGVPGNVELLAGWRKGWHGGVYLSLDNGKTWEDIERNLKHDEILNPTRAWSKGFGRPNAVAFDVFSPKTIYFTDWWGAWRSDDRGMSWSEKINGSPNTCGSDMHITPEGEIYVATLDNGLLKSVDGGRSYKPIFPKKGYRRDASGHVWRVISKPTNPNYVIATSSPWDEGVNQVIISKDGGVRFITAKDGLPAKRPKVNTMWGQGYPRAIALDPKRPHIIYLGIDGNDGGGLYISRDGGLHWEYSKGQPGSKRIYNALAVDPTNPHRLFWGACKKEGGVYKSEDSGKSWKKVFSTSNRIFDIAISKSGIIYVAGSKRKKSVLYASYNKGKSWQLLFSLNDKGSCEAIYIDPSDETRIFVGVVRWNGYTGGRIFHSSNGGKDWIDITGGLPVFSGPAAMAIDSRENMLYVLLCRGSVYKRKINTL